MIEARFNGKRFGELYRSKGFNPTSLARTIARFPGCGRCVRANIDSWENGRNVPNMVYGLAILEVLGMLPDDRIRRELLTEFETPDV